MNITITGNLGSGKSSVCKELEKAGFTIVSAGDIFREIAEEKGMTVIELNEAAKSDRQIDDLLDNRSIELGKKMDHTVFDSRLAWHFVENSFKVFLLADTEEAAERVFAGANRSAEEYRDVSEARAGLESRAKLEQERFSKLYGIDYYDGSNYDLVIESSAASPEQIAQEIIRNFALYQKKPFGTKVELNLKCLYPAQDFASMDKQRMEQCVREEKESSQALCSVHQPSITVKNGYNYILNGHHHVFAALAAGKVFAEIQNINMEQAAQDAVKLPDKDSLNCFEKAGAFQYRIYPADMPQRIGYTLDFSKIFNI